MFIAHIRQSDFVKQSVFEHSENVALLARKFGEPLNIGALCELAGFLHDMGKLTEKFNNYIENAVIRGVIETEKIDHSTAGAKYLYENFYHGDDKQKFVVEIVGMAILSHHSGLQNFTQIDLSESDYIRRVKKNLPYYDEVKRNFEANSNNRKRVENLINESIKEFENFISIIKPLKHPFVYINLLQKLVLSILLDADRTDSRRFEENDNSPIERNFPFKEKYETMLKNIESLNTAKNKINILRADMSEKCDKKAEDGSGLFTLSIPTGGGKTYSSLRYALKHAYLYGKKRIIYIVPYTTILEQNAQSVRQILNDYENVLEHHANIIEITDSEQDFYDNPIQKKLELARDNWDMPIIFTTMVQFLDVFFQKGTKKTRRMHRLTNSIVIIDEVQTVPYIHFPLFNMAINFLFYIGKSSIILSTATQPTVEKMEYAIDIRENHEIITDLHHIIKEFKRVKIHDCIDTNGWNSEQLADKVLHEIKQKHSALIILNTKSAVRKLYQTLKNKTEEFNNDIKIYHLSTSMCPAHRQKVLDIIRKQLKNEKIICVSTQLIEAGVDISFQVVFRSLAGLDSIAQAAGRCNRHGENELGDVFVIKSNEEILDKLPEIRIGKEVMENLIIPINKWEEKLFNPEIIKKYFKEFDLQASREINKNPKELDISLIDLINGKIINEKKTLTISSFKTLEKHFEAISSPTKSLLVPYEEGEDIIARLNEEVSLRELNLLLKKSQRYSINVYEYEFNKLKELNLINELYNDGILVVRDKGYSEEYGLSIEDKGILKHYNF